MMIFTVSMIIILSIGCCSLLFWSYKNMACVKAELNNHQQKYNQIKRECKTLQNADGFFQKDIKNLKIEFRKLQQQFDSLQQARIGDASYAQANKLLEMGASQSDLIDTCQISKAEAELLENLKTYKEAIVNK